MKYIESENPNEDFKLFKDADKKLKKLDDDKYKYRQIYLYSKVIKKMFFELSDENKEYIRQACRYIEKRKHFMTDSISDEMAIETVRLDVLKTLSDYDK